MGLQNRLASVNEPMQDLHNRHILPDGEISTIAWEAGSANTLNE